MELEMAKSGCNTCSVALQVHPSAFRVSDPGLVRDGDYCRGVVRVTVCVQTMQVCLHGLVQTSLNMAM